MKGLHTLVASTLLLAAMVRPALPADDELAQRIAACTAVAANSCDSSIDRVSAYTAPPELPNR